MAGACHSIARWLTQAGKLVAILYDSISPTESVGISNVTGASRRQRGSLFVLGSAVGAARMGYRGTFAEAPSSASSTP
jgi:hypothetical protein